MVLPGGIPLREPWPSEEEFFRQRPEVTGLASDDGAVVINPYARCSQIFHLLENKKRHLDSMGHLKR